MSKIAEIADEVVEEKKVPKTDEEIFQAGLEIAKARKVFNDTVIKICKGFEPDEAVQAHGYANAKDGTYKAQLLAQHGQGKGFGTK